MLRGSHVCFEFVFVLLVVFSLVCGVGVCIGALGWTGRRGVGLWDSCVCGQLQTVSARFSSSTWFVLLFGGEGRGSVLFDGRVRGCII